MMTQIQPGFYTIVYADGQYRTLRFRAGKDRFEGKVIASYKDGTEYIGFGFLEDGNRIRFWRVFTETNPPERTRRIQRAIDTIDADQNNAAMMYAMNENCCSRCGRQLTVPASIAGGLGPECAKNGQWTQEDNKEVFDHLAEASAPDLSLGRARPGWQFAA